MTEDIEARLKAIEEKLNPSPDKMSTMKASNRLKQMLDSKKGEKESQEDVVWRLNEQAEKVPELEKELQKTKAEATNYRNLVIGYDKSLQDTCKECEDLKKDKGLLLQDVVESKRKVKENCICLTSGDLNNEDVITRFNKIKNELGMNETELMIELISRANIG